MSGIYQKLNSSAGVLFSKRADRRWQRKMYFFLTIMSVMYVLSTLVPDGGDDAIVESIRKRIKWDNDDYIY
ncbi:hypothetical protein Tco_0193981 [Tanacetum coccineum]